MAKLADAADLKSADLNRSWGFKSPSGHQISNWPVMILAVESLLHLASPSERFSFEKVQQSDATAVQA